VLKPTSSITHCFSFPLSHCHYYSSPLICHLQTWLLQPPLCWPARYPVKVLGPRSPLCCPSYWLCAKIWSCHWLHARCYPLAPHKQRIEYRVAALVWNCLINLALPTLLSLQAHQQYPGHMLPSLGWARSPSSSFSPHLHQAKRVNVQFLKRTGKVECQMQTRGSKGSPLCCPSYWLCAKIWSCHWLHADKGKQRVSSLLPVLKKVGHFSWAHNATWVNSWSRIKPMLSQNTSIAFIHHAQLLKEMN